jgi:hypothetical protein
MPDPSDQYTFLYWIIRITTLSGKRKRTGNPKRILPGFNLFSLNSQKAESAFHFPKSIFQAFSAGFLPA